MIYPASAPKPDGLVRVEKVVRNDRGELIGKLHLSLNQRVTIEKTEAERICDHAAGAVASVLKYRGHLT